MLQSSIIGSPPRRKGLALAVIVAAQFMVVLDIAIVNVALPAIKGDLHFAEGNLQWVISAYAILFGGVLLLGGRLADVFGRRRVFMIGLAVFSISSLLCGLSWSEGSLIAFRALQGLRSEERRVGKECRSRWSPYHYKKNSKDRIEMR